MKHLYTFVWLLGLLLLAASCNKKSRDISISSSQNTNETQLNKLFSPLKPIAQNYVVTAGTNQTIYGQEGTRIVFYKNSFKDQNGKIITGSTVNIELIEMYHPGEVIANRAATSANGLLLGSGGQVYIKATVAGQEVFANKYGIGFMQSTPANQPMALFYGNAGNADSIVNWTSGASGLGTTAGTTRSFTDSITLVVIGNTGEDTITLAHTPASYYQFDSCVSFNWVNCDYFYGYSAQLSDISVIVPDSFYLSNTEVFLVFPAINSVTHLGRYTADTHTFDLYSGYYVPVGMNVDVIVIANKNGNYYYFQQKSLTTSNGMVVSTPLAPQTLTYIQAQLAGL